MVLLMTIITIEKKEKLLNRLQILQSKTKLEFIQRSVLPQNPPKLVAVLKHILSTIQSQNYIGFPAGVIMNKHLLKNLVAMIFTVQSQRLKKQALQEPLRVTNSV